MRLTSAAVRLLLATGGVIGTALAARRPQVGVAEAALFRRVNRLPDALYGPVWVVMQGGALGAAPLSAGAATLLGRPATAERLLVGGGSAWLVAKLVKRGVRRPRPMVLLGGTRIRGREASGLGFLSGHAAVSTALAAAVAEAGPGRLPLIALGFAGTVSVARIYVGAHLPLDVAGGVFLGLAVHAASDVVSAVSSRSTSAARREPGQPPGP